MSATMARYADPDAEFVRVAICGSVDSGKSTLLGRMVLDAGLVLDDERPVNGALDLALLADGLEAEAEQGITIDVAYRHFATARRTYLFADAPGHLQYTRNMATAASLAAIAIVVVDAVVGVTEQTQRHLAICAAMGVRTVIAAVNKLDEVDYSEQAFDTLVDELDAAAATLGIDDLVAIPIAARDGDNVTVASPHFDWFAGPTLVDALDAAPAARWDADAAPLRMPVRVILRPDSGERWIAGTIASGSIAVGDEIGIAGRPLLGGGVRVTDLVTARGAVERATANTAVRLRVDTDVDVSRGDVLCALADIETGLAQAAEVRLVWLHELPLEIDTRYVVRAGTRWMFARVTEVAARLDLATLESLPADGVGVNEIADVRLEFAQPIPLDTFADHRESGALILVDPSTSSTVAAAMATSVTPARRSSIRPKAAVTREQRAMQLGQNGHVLWFTGLSGSGKSTITRAVETRLHERGLHTFIIDGDSLRLGLCGDLGFSPDDRTENIRRAAETARLMLEAGVIVLCEFISPMQIDRLEARRIIGDADFTEVYVHASLETCIERDPKGLYTRALAGELPEFTGISSPYEPPTVPDLVLDTETETIEESVARVVDVAIEQTRIDRLASKGASQPRSARTRTRA